MSTATITSGVKPIAIQIACQTTRPMRCGCRAPSYWATNVFAYEQMPSGKHNTENQATSQ